MGSKADGFSWNKMLTEEFDDYPLCVILFASSGVFAQRLSV
jgi:hypothetical protein